MKISIQTIAMFFCGILTGWVALYTGDHKFIAMSGFCFGATFVMGMVDMLDLH